MCSTDDNLLNAGLNRHGYKFENRHFDTIYAVGIDANT